MFNSINDAKTFIDNSGLFEWIKYEKLETVYEWAFRNADSEADIQNYLESNLELCK